MTLTTYRVATPHDSVQDSNVNSQQSPANGPIMFVSLLEFISEIYQVVAITRKVISWNLFHGT